MALGVYLSLQALASCSPGASEGDGRSASDRLGQILDENGIAHGKIGMDEHGGWSVFTMDSVPLVSFGPWDLVDPDRLGNLAKAAAANDSLLVQSARRLGFDPHDPGVSFGVIEGSKVMFCKLVGRGWLSLLDTRAKDGSMGFYLIYDHVETLVLDVLQPSRPILRSYVVRNSSMALHGANVYRRYWADHSFRRHKCPIPHAGLTYPESAGWHGRGLRQKPGNVMPAWVGAWAGDREATGAPIQGLEVKAAQIFAEKGLRLSSAYAFWHTSGDGRTSHFCQFYGTDENKEEPENGECLVLTFDVETLDLASQGIGIGANGCEVMDMDTTSVGLALSLRDTAKPDASAPQ